MVIKFQGVKRNKLIEMYPLYKRDGKIIAQNHALFHWFYKKTIGKRAFTAQTCYQFVDPYNSSAGEHKTSEWVVDAE